MDLNEQELFRRESLAKLRELGIEPYPAALYPINTSAAQVKAEYDAKGYKPASAESVVSFEAEYPTATSSQTIYPIEDRSDAANQPTA